MGALDETIITKKYLIASRSYYHDKITWCVRERQPIPKWKNLFKMCSDPVVYITYTIMTISFVYTFYFMQQFEEQQKWDSFSILNMAIANMCGSGSNYNPKNNSHRTFFIFLVFAGMLLNIIVISFALFFITNQIFEEQTDTVQKIIENQFKLVGDEFALHHLVRQNQVNNLVFESKNFSSKNFILLYFLSFFFSKFNHFVFNYF